MGKATQYRNWAITWQINPHQLTETSRNGIGIITGNYSYMLFVGPKESPDNECSSDHQHVMVHCKDANVSKKKAKEVLVEYSHLAAEEVESAIIYISKIHSSKVKYIAYIFKSLNEESLSRDDEVVKSVIEEIKEDNIIPTSSGVKRKLIDSFGATAYNKRFKNVIETYMTETDIVDERGNPTVIIDSKINHFNFITQLMYWFLIITQTHVSTGCKIFKDISEPMLKDIVFLISLLPYFTKRVTGCCDSIPSLYLYGTQNAGQSSMFNNCRYIRKVPTDASGVSRFRMDKMHTAFLFDDIEGSYFNILGLPMIKLGELFKEVGLDILDYVKNI